MQNDVHSQAEETGKSVISSPFAGSWYPGDPEKLREFFREVSAETEPEEDTIALIMPHAGYLYSGTAAGLAAAKVRGLAFERIVLHAPSHRAYLKDQFCLPGASHFSTQLGEVPVDTDAVETLLRNGLFLRDNRIHRNEHSTQLEIPFLQAMLKPGFRLLPVIVGICGKEVLEEAARVLKPLIDEKTLVVASSDFTHYGKDYDYVPFVHDIRESLKALDMGAFHFIERKSPDHFRTYLEKTGATICGSYPIELLLRLLPEDAACELQSYYVSGDITGDYSNSVSYVGASFTGSWASAKEPQKMTEGELTENDKRLLLSLARATIARKFDPSRPLPDLSSLSPAAKKKMGAFVTLNIDGRLRGCIGEILPMRPLVKAVAGRALDAAFRDPRFYPLREEEFGKVTIEISALTPPHHVNSWQEIEIGKHGILLQKGNAGAVFLPQVAPEQGWGLEETLVHLSMKAGLDPDAWKNGAEFDVFEAVVFHE